MNAFKDLFDIGCQYQMSFWKSDEYSIMEYKKIVYEFIGRLLIRVFDYKFCNREISFDNAGKLRLLTKKSIRYYQTYFYGTISQHDCFIKKYKPYIEFIIPWNEQIINGFAIPPVIYRYQQHDHKLYRIDFDTRFDFLYYMCKRAKKFEETMNYMQQKIIKNL